jgi:hypothetical protein
MSTNQDVMRDAEEITLRVFVSSPNDVRPERLIAERVVRRLDQEFSIHLHLRAVRWEREPLRASAHPQSEITPPHDCDIVVLVLWSKLGRPLPADRFPGPLSGKEVTGSEWEFEDALKSHRERDKPDVLVYRKTTAPSASLDDTNAARRRCADMDRVEDFFRKWFVDPTSRFPAGTFRRFDDGAAFEEMLEDHLRGLLARRIDRTTDTGALAAWRRSGNPYRGLSSFEPEDAGLFFGRSRARNELREVLERGTAFALVFGASGSGKSSLVKAGLLADLALPGMIGAVALVRYAVLRPSDRADDLLAGLAAAVLAPTALPELAGRRYTPERLSTLLRKTPEEALLAIGQALAEAARNGALAEDAAARVLIVIDQLEELFTIEHLGQPAREEFVAALGALAKSGFVWVVATMRSDFFDRLERLPALAALSAGEGRYLLLPPDAAEIGQIIRGPAREAGLRFEIDAVRAQGLDDAILRATEHAAGALPLLSFLLDQLWRRRTAEGLLTFAAYDDLGGLEGAIGHRAEEVFRDQPEAVRGELPALLRALVTVTGDAATARSAPLVDFPEGSPGRTLVAAAARLTGGGHNAFSRYERGEATPLPAVINLFRLVDKHPELLQELAPS